MAAEQRPVKAACNMLSPMKAVNKSHYGLTQKASGVCDALVNC
jgi:hypothetical protein